MVVDRVRLVLFSSQPALAAGLSSIFSCDPSIEVIGSVQTASDLLATLERTRPDVLLVDYCYDANPKLIAQVRRQAPQVRVVIWMHGIEAAEAQYLSEIGVRGFLPKDASCEELRNCLLAVAEGEISMSRELMQMLLKGRRVRLSRRELQLLRLLGHGFGNKRIAEHLQIQEGTVKVYLSRLFRKMEVSDRFELALYALKHFRHQGATAVEDTQDDETWLRCVILEPKEQAQAARAGGYF